MDVPRNIFDTLLWHNNINMFLILILLTHAIDNSALLYSFKLHFFETNKSCQGL